MTPSIPTLEEDPSPKLTGFLRFCRPICMVWLVSVLLPMGAHAQGPASPAAGLDSAPFQPMQALRNWWIEAPGGRYGLMELTTHSVWSEPRAKIRRTTLLFGPWHWTLDASAPQILTVLILLILALAFVTGWIRTKRYGL